MRPDRYGIHSAQPAAEADRKCPDLLLVPLRMEVYQQAFRRIREILKGNIELIEPYALDEASLDVTTPKKGPPSGPRSSGSSTSFGWELFVPPTKSKEPSEGLGCRQTTFRSRKPRPLGPSNRFSTGLTSTPASRSPPRCGPSKDWQGKRLDGL